MLLPRLHAHTVMQTAPGTETSTRRPSLQVQKCFYSELLPPPREPGQTRCVCHSLVIRQRLPAPKISSPHLSPSGEECKCSNSCVYLFPLGQIEAKETTKQSKSQFFPHLHKGYRSRCTVFVSSGCIISSLSFYINNVWAAYRSCHMYKSECCLSYANSTDIQDAPDGCPCPGCSWWVTSVSLSPLTPEEPPSEEPLRDGRRRTESLVPNTWSPKEPKGSNLLKDDFTGWSILGSEIFSLNALNTRLGSFLLTWLLKRSLT